jgi:predicted DNA binding CopG/RHH family protein
MARQTKLRDEDQERDYWANHDSVEELDWSKAKRATLPELKPSTRTISLRLPESMLEALKLLANRQDVPYQSLIKVFLAERMEQEFGEKPGPRRVTDRRHNKALQPTRPSRALGTRG